MFKVRLFAHLFLALSGCLASSMVFAATDADLLGLPWPQIAVGTVIALWGGLTRTSERALEASMLQRDRIEEALPPPPAFHLWHEISRDLLLSTGIGFLMYGVGSALGLGRLEMGASLWMSGYLGPRLLAGLGDAALGYIKQRSGTT